MSKKILFISMYSDPEIYSSSYYVNDLKKHLISCGFKVTTIAPNPVRGLTKEKILEYKNKQCETNEFGKIYRIWISKNYSNNLFNYFSRMFIYFFKLKKYLRCNCNNFNYIFLPSNPPIFIPLMVEKIARNTKCKVIYNINDIWPDVIGKYNFLKPLAKKAFIQADSLVTLSEDMKQTLVEKGVSKNKISIIRIWPNTQIDKKSNLNEFYEENKFNVFYIGNIGFLQNIELLIKVANLCKDEGVHFNIVGSGRRQKKIAKMISKCKTNNITYRGYLDSTVANALYKKSDLNLISLTKKTIKYACPSKTSTCIEAKKPCLLIVDDSNYSRFLCEKYNFSHNSTFKADLILKDIEKIKKSKFLPTNFQNIYDKNINLKLWETIFED